MRASEVGLKDADYYVPVAEETVRWGFLPDNTAKPILSVPSGSTVVFDTLSHEGILEDQGRNPEKFFGGFGVPPNQVLNDAKALTSSSMQHDFAKDGPHVVIGPLQIDDAQPGDVLEVSIVAFHPRVPYGVISNRHGKGALPGEFPETPDAAANASAQDPKLFNNVFKFIPIEQQGGRWYGMVKGDNGAVAKIPLAPFLGTMGVAPNTAGRPNSIPPGTYGGNLDIHYLTPGAKLYLPVQVPGGMFFLADPHFAQGNGEVSLTAIEGWLRATLKLTVIKNPTSRMPLKQGLTGPFAETADYWIPIGLDPDLNEAMKKATREAMRFISANLNMDRATAIAYLSAGTDFEVSQVVDRTKGVHGLIRKSDFASSR